MTSNTFAQLGLSHPLVAALSRRGINEPFPVQTAAIPSALGGRDVQGQAPTGSGKTLAFGLPLLSRVGKAGRGRPRALVLVPTRELAEQISRDLSPLCGVVDRRIFAIYGGVGYGQQLAALRSGVDVLVATPGRLEDLIEQGHADLSQVGLAVVDEADRMADMGFLPAVERILGQTEPGRQMMLFSATLDGDVAALARRFQTDPVAVKAESSPEAQSEAIHHFWRVNRSDRVEHTANLIRESGRSIVFTRTRRGADRLAKQLGNAGLAVAIMHGGRSQGQRTRALAEFSKGRAHALVATGVAARGIHVDDVASVIHYDPAEDHKEYLHRSGRTARAGAKGTVVTLLSGDQEGDVRTMQRKLDLRVPIVPAEMERLRHDAVGHRSPTHEARNSTATRPSRSTRPEGRSIFVGNLPWTATEDDLERLFAAHGAVERATIVKQRGTGRSKGFGFVDMADGYDTGAIAALEGVRMGGRRLEVRPAR